MGTPPRLAEPPPGRTRRGEPISIFLGEMTSPEVEAFLREHQTVIVPIGSTEQHGPHGRC